jgi:hypothetical protein
MSRRAVKMKPAARQGARLESEVRRGLTLRVSWSRSGRTVTPHWMVDRRGVRVLNFWPATLRWWRPSRGESGRAKAVWDVIALASADARSHGKARQPDAAPAVPQFVGWYRAVAGEPWSRLAEVADYGETWGQLLDRLPAGQGGESVVLAAGCHPDDGKQRKGARS